MASTTTTSCARHRRRESLAACASCGAPMCSQCMVSTPVGFKCPSCTSPAAVRTPGAASGATRRRPSPWLLAAGVLVAVGALALLVLRDGGGSDDPAVVQTEASPRGERQVQIDGAGGVTLAGTLALPEADAGSAVPGVLILPGFGPTNRDGVSAAGGVDPLYQDVSASLTEAGMASFRYDKRGTGASPLPEDLPLSFDDLVSDAGTALSFLAERKGIDPERLAVVGHEEGGLVALRLAASDPAVRAVVAVSTPGRPFLDVLVDDFTNSGHGQDVEALRAAVAGLLATGSLPPGTELSTLPDFFPADQEEYLTEIFSVDPAALAREVDVPVLVVRGGLATGNTAADADSLVAALGPDAEVVVSPDGGPTLAIAPRTATPTSLEGGADHDHAGAGALERDDAAVERMAAWLGTALS